MPLTVLAVADQVSDLLYEYFRPERWRNIDLVLSCGDLPPSYLDFLGSSLNVPVLYVRGNHDDYEEGAYVGGENVHGRIAEYRGVRIAGFEGSRRYNDGPHQYSDRQMKRLLRWLRFQAWRKGPPDIVLTHAPPSSCHSGEDICHRGFEAFDTAIKIWRPSFFIHGHVHAYNSDELVTCIGDTTVINAYPYHVFKIQPAAEREAATARAAAPSPARVLRARDQHL